MFYIACTRFNNITYNENITYRNTHQEIVIYGSTLKIREIYPLGCLIFIAEMNNDENRIEGIGLIQNLLVNDRTHHIYDNTEYNRYIYRGKYWLNRTQINQFDPIILEIFDNILFKGKSHLKCRIGITIITERLFIHWNYDLRDLKYKVKNLFIYYFTYNIDNESVIEENILDKYYQTNKVKEI
jgi:hypothetical protein